MNMDEKRDEIRKQMEAILFASARIITMDEFRNSLQLPEATIKIIIEDLKEHLENIDGPVYLDSSPEGYKLNVKEKYMPLVQKLVSNTELSRTVMQTLAIIAFKQPILQSLLIKIRTNKAYDHIAELEDKGFITKKKKGRSYSIRLTQKFYEYFDIPNDDKLKDFFKNIADDTEELSTMAELNEATIIDIPEKTEIIIEKDLMDGLEVYTSKEDIKDDEQNNEDDTNNDNQDTASNTNEDNESEEATEENTEDGEETENDKSFESEQDDSEEESDNTQESKNLNNR